MIFSRFYAPDASFFKIGAGRRKPLQGLIYSSIYETAVEKFGQDAYDNACD